MRILVAAKQLEITGALREFIQTQAQKIAKLHKRVTQVRVFIEKVSKKRNDPLANIVTFEIQTPGKNVVVKKHAVDMYQAIVQATESATRQLRKQYEKRMTLKRYRLAQS